MALIRPVHYAALPKTGQTTGYRTGDDRDFQTGDRRTTRFQDCGDGTILDHATGLMWVQQPELIIPGGTGQVASAEGVWAVGSDYVAGDLVQGDGAPDALFYVCILANGPGGVGAQEPPNATYWVETVWAGSAADLLTPATMLWNPAIDNCLALDYAGHTDWRLPNVNEMFSIGSSATRYPAVDSTYFPNVINDEYYTSTTYHVVSTFALTATHWYYTQASSAHKASDAELVLPVRGGIINA